MCALGISILSSTNYIVIPTRRMKPEMYEFSASSMDGKKALLMSLSPMLSENETQRKIDINACESYTRCRSAKGKGRFSVYEYMDLDNGIKVNYDEFERRYSTTYTFSKSHYLIDLLCSCLFAWR